MEANLGRTSGPASEVGEGGGCATVLDESRLSRLGATSLRFNLNGREQKTALAGLAAVQSLETSLFPSRRAKKLLLIGKKDPNEAPHAEARNV